MSSLNIDKILSSVEKNKIDTEYYVYCAYGKDGKLLYVGKGSGERYKHCNSGCSSSKELNRYYFLNGEDSSMTVKIVKHFQDNKEAVDYEKYCIAKLKPKFNLQSTKPEKLTNEEKLERGLLSNFKIISLMYYEAKQSGDEDKARKLLQCNDRLMNYVEELGIEILRTCGFQESKIKRKFNASVGASRLIESPKKIQKILKFEVGDRYTFKDIKDKLSKAYVKLKITQTAKAKDIEQYYHVKRTNINGVNGYKIVGEV